MTLDFVLELFQTAGALAGFVALWLAAGIFAGLTRRRP